MKDRDPRELLLSFKARCLVHFAVDTEEVWMTTKLNGINTYFAVQQGKQWRQGKPCWEQHLPDFVSVGRSPAKDSLLDIVQRFIHLQEDKRILKSLL